MKVKSQIIFFTLLMMATFGLSSCSEDDNEVEEFPDWQEYNEAYWNELYSTTEQKIASGDTSWKIIRNYSFTENAVLENTDYIIVNVKEEGTGSGCPLYTDSVRVHYQGRLLPSTSYSAGYLFDSSWTGDFDARTAIPAKLAIDGVIDGWATALQNMHIGDHWVVYIPYTLAYGKSDYGTSTTIPGYSTLIFDITLVAYWRAGTSGPDFKSKQGGVWIEE